LALQSHRHHRRVFFHLLLLRLLSSLLLRLTHSRKSENTKMKKDQKKLSLFDIKISLSLLARLITVTPLPIQAVAMLIIIIPCAVVAAAFASRPFLASPSPLARPCDASLRPRAALAERTVAHAKNKKWSDAHANEYKQTCFSSESN
jgi:hypothetical protein